MCVIAIKGKGVAMPTQTRIEDMWRTNSHGAGFMYTYDNAVYIEKGFMTLQEFNDALAGLTDKLAKDDLELKDIPIIMHFRITTHGGTSRENTHPFPITNNEEFLRALDVRASIGVAHNGIISSMPKEDTLSDTQIYIREILHPLSAIGNDFVNKFETLISSTIGYSKLAFLYKNGTIITFGDFKESADSDGLKYSNLNFVPYAWKNNKTSNEVVRNYYRNYDDYDYKDLYETKVLKDIYDVEMVKGKEYYRYVDFKKGLVDEVTYTYTGPFATTTSAWGWFLNPKTNTKVTFRCDTMEPVDFDEPAEPIIIENEPDKTVDKHKFGGKKNIETSKLIQSANRELYTKFVWDYFKLIQVPIGTYLTNSYAANSNYLSDLTADAWTVLVSSNNWYYSQHYSSYFYKNNDNSYTELLNSEIDTELNVENNKIIGDILCVDNPRYGKKSKNTKTIKNAVVYLTKKDVNYVRKD